MTKLAPEWVRTSDPVISGPVITLPLDYGARPWEVLRPRLVMTNICRDTGLEQSSPTKGYPVSSRGDIWVRHCISLGPHRYTYGKDMRHHC